MLVKAETHERKGNWFLQFLVQKSVLKVKAGSKDFFSIDFCIVFSAVAEKNALLYILKQSGTAHSKHWLKYSFQRCPMFPKNSWLKVFFYSFLSHFDSKRGKMTEKEEKHQHFGIGGFCMFFLTFLTHFSPLCLKIISSNLHINKYTLINNCSLL